MDAVILAAGFSSRAGCYKMGLNLGGKSLLQRNIDLFHQICGQVIVVSGYKPEMLQRCISAGDGVRIVHNSHFESGMFSSVLTGVEQSQEDFFITPGDYPELDKNTLHTLARAEGEIRVPAYKGKRGHPVFMEKTMKSLLIQEKRDYNLRDFIRNIGASIIPVEDKGILFDIDTPQDIDMLNRDCCHKKRHTSI